MAMVMGVPIRAPQPVRTAAVLLHIVAFAVLIQAGLTVYRTSAEIDAYLGDEDFLALLGEEFRDMLWYQTVTQTVLMVVLTVGLFVLARYLLRRYQAARVLTWVVAGAGIVTCGLMATSYRLFSPSALFGGADFGFTRYEGLDGFGADAAPDPVPGWLGPTELVLSLVVLLLLIAIAALLAVPVANRYFWHPPRWLAWPPGYAPPPPVMYAPPTGYPPAPPVYFPPPTPGTPMAPEPTIVDTPADPEPESPPDRHE